MRSLFKAFVSVAALSVAQGNPFVGKNADQTSIQRDDGSVAVKMSPVSQAYDKYDALIDRATSYKRPQSLYESTVEAILGKSLEQVDFERSVTDFLEGTTTQHPRSKKRLGDGRLVTAVLDQTAYIWTSPVLMGRYTPMNVVFDTASDWLVVEDVICEDCEGNKYDASQGEQVSDVLKERAYGNVFVKGYVYSDTICIQLSQCVQDFQYFAISEHQGLREPVDGIMGLARNKNVFQRGEGTIDTTTSYVTAMKDEGLIDKEAFSFYFNNKANSYIDFGQYQETSIKDDNEIKYVEVNEDFFWSLDCLAVGFLKRGDELIDMAQKKFKDPVYTIIDTSQPTISIASSYFEEYVDMIFSKTAGKTGNYQVEQGQVLCQCDSNYPSLFFMFGDYWIEITPEEYVLDVSEHNDQSLCIFAISANSEDFNVFGHPLLQGYYSTFDMESGTIGFAPHTQSTKYALADAVLPSKTLSSEHKKMIAEVITWVIIASIATGTFFGYYLGLFPYLHEKYPDNEYYVVGTSTAFWLGVGLLLTYGLRPLFINLLAVSPRHGGVATPDNQNLVNYGTFAYFAGALWIYSKILKSLKGKAAVKEETPVVRTVPWNIFTDCC